MNTHSPIPLRPDRNALREAAMTSLARAAIDTARSVHDRFAKSAWPDDQVAKLITRSAVTQTTLANAQVLQQVGLAFVASLTPVSAAAQIIARSLQLTFEGNARISVPSLTLPHAAWLGEGAPIPVVEGTSSPGTMVDPYKLAMLTALTNEMIRPSANNAETMVRQVLLENAGPTLDAAMFSANAAVPGVQPAGILNGVAPLPPSSGTGYDAMVADIAAIATALAPASGGSEPVLIAAPGQFVPLSMNARNPWSVLMSAALPAGTVIGLVPAALATVVEPPRIEASATTVQMTDQPSAELMTGPTISLYQTDSIGLRFILPATWSLRSPSGVAWIEATSW
jgi:hypothetical protein